MNVRQQGQPIGSLEGSIARSAKREADPASFFFPIFYIFPVLARDKKKKVMSVLSKKRTLS